MNASQILFEKLAPIFDDKIYPLIAPEVADKNPPYAVYAQISATPDNTLDGITGHEWVRVQIDVYHNDYDETIALSAQVVQALNSITPSVYGGTTYLYDDGLYRGLIEYEFWQSF